jgi:hypothetical protein
VSRTRDAQADGGRPREPSRGPGAFRLEGWIAEFLTAKRAAGLSPRSTAHYEDVLGGVFLPFCRGQGLSEPNQLTARHLDALNAGLLDGSLARSGRPLSKPSVASYARSINVFLEWLAREGEPTTGARAQKPRPPSGW